MTPQVPAKRQPVRVLDLSSSARATNIVVEASPAFELLVAITAFGNRDQYDTYDRGRTWFDELRARMPEHLRRHFETFAPGYCHSWAYLAGIVHRAPNHGDVDSVIDHLEATDAGEVYRVVVGGHLREETYRESARLMEAAIRGERADRERLVEWLRGRDAIDMEGVETVALLDPASLQRQMVIILRGWRELLREHLDEVAPLLEREAAELRERISGLSIEQAVETGTNGIAYTPEPGVRTILLIPQVTMSPWVLIGDDEGLKMFFVAASGGAGDARRDEPSPRLLSMCKALAEEPRLRILRRLAAGPASLQQLTEHLGSAKSTTHHHMVVLRAAGLTRVDLGSDHEYALREGLVPELAELLSTYLRAGRG